MLEDTERFINEIRKEDKINLILETFRNDVPQFDFNKFFEMMRKFSKKLVPLKVTIENTDEVNEKIRDLMAISSTLNQMYIDLSIAKVAFRNMYDTAIGYLRNIPNIKSIGKDPEVLVFNEMVCWQNNIDAVFDLMSRLMKELTNITNNIEAQQKNCQMDRWIGTSPRRTTKRDNQVQENNEEEKADALSGMGVWKK